jgi:RNA polymerase sigma-70 factor (ECF subfamily)
MHDITALLREYGPEIHGWMLSHLADEYEAAESYAEFAEELWASLARYGGRCSLRTWCYMLARQRVAKTIQRRTRDRFVGLSEAPAIPFTSSEHHTPLHARTDVKARMRALREALPEDDREILVLRVDKGLDWRDISLVTLGEHASDAAITRHAAGLRKRFERIKLRLRQLAAA